MNAEGDGVKPRRQEFGAERTRNGKEKTDAERPEIPIAHLRDGIMRRGAIEFKLRRLSREEACRYRSNNESA
jgi:hypothetical protein